MKWFKDVRVIIAVLTLVIAGAALGVAIWGHLWASHKYDEITEPHTRFDEIRDKLIMLDNRLSERETWIESAENAGEDRAEDKLHFEEARNLRSDAEMAWVNDDFDEAEQLINDAYSELEKVERYLPPVPFSWWVFGAGMLGGLVIIMALTYLLVWRRRVERITRDDNTTAQKRE